MMKYEKPQLVEISKLIETAGIDIASPDCADGTYVIDTCPGGAVVTPGCNAGGTPLILCGGGGNYT